ncbi:flagellar biosynthesis anti-sigma factor FlgM [Sporosarcina sp. 179-K 3D1 HS]|uniref:flagellar biosynthesis anti-sigma factor FlgM n=1 Tax=Sporosarcina sp. 179-K 3D1 HS TaxID=3232169 RepID=UPI0039A30773
MKINNNMNIPRINPYKSNQIKTEQAKELTKVRADKIEISSEAKQLSETSAFTLERKERVQQLKAQIQDGTYNVDAEKLASNLVNYFNIKK